MKSRDPDGATVWGELRLLQTVTRDLVRHRFSRKVQQGQGQGSTSADKEKTGQTGYQLSPQSAIRLYLCLSRCHQVSTQKLQVFGKNSQRWALHRLRGEKISPVHISPYWHKNGGENVATDTRRVSVSSHRCCVLSLALINGEVRSGLGGRKFWAVQLNSGYCRRQPLK